VKRKFYELSKKYHPDFYINESEGKQKEILELSTLNNKAFQVLTHRHKRVQYVLELNELLTEGEKHQLPQEFLMEMMEVNEYLMELEFDPDESVVEKVSDQVSSIEESFELELSRLASEYDSQEDSEKIETLTLIKDVWYRQKYLLRIRDTLNRFASRN
jgi:molecular chaperone HscB